MLLLSYIDSNCDEQGTAPQTEYSHLCDIPLSNPFLQGIDGCWTEKKRVETIVK